MSNVEILYEGPYDETGIEQMAMSVNGRWFSRHFGSWSGQHGKKCMTPWRPSDAPRRPWPTDKLFVGWGREATEFGYGIVRIYRGPTDEECERAVLGSQSALRLVPGPYKLRLPQSPEERHAGIEAKEIAKSMKTRSSGRNQSSSRL